VVAPHRQQLEGPGCEGSPALRQGREVGRQGAADRQGSAQTETKPSVSISLA
jgi:hypothetical protein